MQVRDVMTADVALARHNDRVIEAARTMADASTAALPVVNDKDQLIGMITDRDITVRAVAAALDLRSTKVREVMTTEIIYCFEDEEACRVTENIVQLQVGMVPVVDRDNRLVGIISCGNEELHRQPVEARATVLRVGPLVLDLIDRKARRGDRAIELLPREFKLLEYLMHRPDQVVTRDMLLKDVWNYRFLPLTNLVDVHVGRLRRKLHVPGDPPLLQCIRGAGFMLFSKVTAPVNARSDVSSVAANSRSWRGALPSPG